MESLDDVIDAMIADRVIHRHRRKWLIVIASILVLAVVVLFTGGWKEKVGRKVATLAGAGHADRRPVRVQLHQGRDHPEPEDEYSAAEAELRVYFDLKNIDTERRHQSHPRQSAATGPRRRQRVRQVQRRDLPAASWLAARLRAAAGELLQRSSRCRPTSPPTRSRSASWASSTSPTTALLGANDEPYWHNEAADAVVQLKPTIVGRRRTSEALPSGHRRWSASSSSCSVASTRLVDAGPGIRGRRTRVIVHGTIGETDRVRRLDA